MKPLRHIHLFFLAGSLLVGQDTTINSFQYSTILETPNLSFIKHVYSGLDILEQMDFKPIEGKSIALFTNQTAVNRNGIHILDLLKDAPNVKVVALLASENGIWGIANYRF